MKCREIMTLDPRACTADDMCMAVAKTLCDADVGSVPVIDDAVSRRVVGMITDRDICCRVVANGLDGAETRVRQVMTTNVVCCRLDDSIEEAERVMEACQIRRVPVVDDHGRLRGIVAQADVARADPRNVGGVVEAISRPMTSTEPLSSPVL